MTDNLRRYTVSSVVNTDTGELVGTPVVRAGHEDYNTFHTVNPLAANEQFRWVHVWAPNPDAAAAADVLTADLRSGGDRNRPVARALTGAAGLKPFSVAAVVHARSGRPIGEPIVAEGHHALAGATFVGRWGTRAHTVNVWALDHAAAVAQAFGADPDSGRVPGSAGMGSARGDPTDRAQTGVPDTEMAQREWNRLAGMPAAARAVLVADTVWNRDYPPAYRTAYTAAAIRVAAAATDAAATNPGAWLTLHELSSVAGQAISRLAPDQPAAPPADQRTVAAAQAAAAKPGPQPRWQRIAALATAAARTAGVQAGTLTAATDILAGWRAYSGHAIAEGVTINGRPARAWIGELLAAVNRDIAAPAAATGRTVAQLAREDQARGVFEPQAASAPNSRARTAASPAPASTTTRRTP
ncbi:hypothetical protein [Phytohabitans aurantiacus]|uniref:Uncharacterized protein n=1 Tax=Phytohabitans aurantiacus TaxID=3016789 RepID=A0ABQ5R3B8_9ACTN|nr:hypothetical protein [Phytohabitans aurantiacus]GLI00910.1 hypothetical protein Pa4123_61860 [Phytohabitans aurantiacus]